MQTQVVPGMNGGCILFSADYERARERRFPHAGIQYGPNFYSAERGKIFVCPLCVKAKGEYKAPK